MRDDIKTLKKQYDKTEDDLKALQSVGQIIGEVLKQLDEERCEQPPRRRTRDACRCLPDQKAPPASVCRGTLFADAAAHPILAVHPVARIPTT